MGWLLRRNSQGCHCTDSLPCPCVLLVLPGRRQGAGAWWGGGSPNGHCPPGGRGFRSVSRGECPTEGVNEVRKCAVSSWRSTVFYGSSVLPSVLNCTKLSSAGCCSSFEGPVHFLHSALAHQPYALPGQRASHCRSRSRTCQPKSTPPEDCFHLKIPDDLCIESPSCWEPDLPTKYQTRRATPPELGEANTDVLSLRARDFISDQATDLA